MSRIITNSDTLSNRPATSAEIADMARLEAEATRKREEAAARYIAARAKVLGWAPTFEDAGFWLCPGKIDTSAAFEKACRMIVERQVRAANPYQEGISIKAAGAARNPRPSQWAEAAEAVAAAAEPAPAWMRAASYDQAAGW